MSDRSAIPAAIRRQVLVEANHRCAICSYPLTELAHIIPFRQCKEHKVENLIALCPNCHDRFDKKGDLTLKDLEAYKKRVVAAQGLPHRVDTLEDDYSSFKKKIESLETRLSELAEQPHSEQGDSESEYKLIQNQIAQTKDACDLFLDGIKLLDNGSTEEALDCFTRSNSILETFQAWNNIGILQGKLGNSEKAYEAFDVAEKVYFNEMGSRDSSHALNRGNVFAKEGLHEDARKCYQDAKDRRLENKLPLDLEIDINIAASFAAMGDFDSALDVLKEVEEKYEESEATPPPHLYNNLAASYHDRGEVAKALEAMKKAEECRSKLDMPEICEYWSNLGRMLNDVERHIEAGNAFRKSISIRKARSQSVNDELYAQAGGQYFLAKEYDLAIEMFEFAVDIYKNNRKQINLLAFVALATLYDEHLGSSAKACIVSRLGLKMCTEYGCEGVEKLTELANQYCPKI